MYRPPNYSLESYLENLDKLFENSKNTIFAGDTNADIGNQSNPTTKKLLETFHNNDLEIINNSDPAFDTRKNNKVQPNKTQRLLCLSKNIHSRMTRNVEDFTSRIAQQGCENICLQNTKPTETGFKTHPGTQGHLKWFLPTSL